MAKTQKNRKNTRKTRKTVRNTTSKNNSVILVGIFAIVFVSAVVFSDFDITGFATIINGTTTLTISQEAAISVSENSTINFGTCTPTAGGLNMTSNSSSAPSECTSGDFPGMLQLRNTGNQDVSITIDSNLTAAQFIQGTSPEFAFTFVNYSLTSGCKDNDSTEWHEFNAPFSAEQDICSNLPVSNRMNISLQAFIPDDTGTQVADSVAIQFTAAGV